MTRFLIAYTRVESKGIEIWEGLAETWQDALNQCDESEEEEIEQYNISIREETKILPDGDYILADGAAWFEIQNISIHLQQTDEGVVCDMYPLHRETNDSLASTYAFFAEAEPEKEPQP